MNKRLLIIFMVVGLVVQVGYAQEGDIQVDHATRNIFTSAQMFFAALTVLPPKIKVVMTVLSTVQSDVEKQILLFKQSDDVSIKLHAMASLVDQMAIATEVVIGSYVKEGVLADYGHHNFSGIALDIGSVIAIGDLEAGEKIKALVPVIQDKLVYLDAISLSLHKIADEFAQAVTMNNRGIFENVQVLMEAMNAFPAQIDLVTATYNQVITTLKTDYEILTTDGDLPKKVDVLADMVNQLAIIAELCVGSKLLVNSTMDIGKHSYSGVLNDLTNVLVTLDPETGEKVAAVLAIAHEKVSYLDKVASALHTVAQNLKKMNNKEVVPA